MNMVKSTANTLIIVASALLSIALISYFLHGRAVPAFAVPGASASNRPVDTAGSSPVSLLTGNRLAGWHSEGQAVWQSENGELSGTTGTNGGGWLFLND